MDPDAFAERFAAGVTEILGAELVGIYLHGSLALGSFNPSSSDVDFLVVTKRRMDPAVRRRFAELALGHSKRPYPLEVTVLTRSNLVPWRYPTPFDFHFGESWRERTVHALARDPFELDFQAANSDLAAEVAVVRERGRRLRGEDVLDVFPPVPERDVVDSMRRDLAWARANDRATYGVLNACRTLAHLAGRRALSKADAARWATSHIAREHRKAVEDALGAYEGDGAPPDSERAWAFVSSVESALVPSPGGNIPPSAISAA